MVESAAHLVDHVFPEAPVRQFVLTFPFPLRFLLAAEPKALTEVLAVVQRGISTFVVQHSGLTVSSGARTGAVTLIQRFGSALNLNPHLHMLFLDAPTASPASGRSFTAPAGCNPMNCSSCWIPSAVESLGCSNGAAC